MSETYQTLSYDLLTHILHVMVFIYIIHTVETYIYVSVRIHSSKWHILKQFNSKIFDCKF